MKYIIYAILIVVLSFSLMSCSDITQYTHAKKAIRYAVQGNFAQAEKEFRKMPALNPYDLGVKTSYLRIIKDVTNQKIQRQTAIHIFRAIDYINFSFAKDKFADIIKESKEAININPDYDESYYYLGFGYAHTGMLDEAIIAFKKAIDINPDHALVHFQLGTTYLKKNSLDEAEIELKRTIAINPNSAEAHYNLSVLYNARGQYDLAIEHVDTAIKIGYLESIGIKIEHKLLENLEPHRRK